MNRKLENRNILFFICIDSFEDKSFKPLYNLKLSQKYLAFHYSLSNQMIFILK